MAELLRGRGGVGPISIQRDPVDPATLNDRITGIVDHGHQDRPAPASVRSARRTIADRSADSAALGILIAEAVADFRDFMISERDAYSRSRLYPDDALTGRLLRGTCPVGRDVTAEALAAQLRDAGVRARIERHQAVEVFGARQGQQHGFITVRMGNRSYLVDPTFAQFFSESRNPRSDTQHSADVLRGSNAGLVFAQELLANGFVELTPENARLYAQALRVPAAQQESAAQRLLTGVGALLREEVGQGVRLTLGRPVADDGRVTVDRLLTRSLPERIAYLDGIRRDERASAGLRERASALRSAMARLQVRVSFAQETGARSNTTAAIGPRVAPTGSPSPMSRRAAIGQAIGAAAIPIHAAMTWAANFAFDRDIERRVANLTEQVHRAMRDPEADPSQGGLIVIITDRRQPMYPHTMNERDPGVLSEFFHYPAGSTAAEAVDSYRSQPQLTSGPGRFRTVENTLYYFVPPPVPMR
ncbi:hypothetical protein [Nocardia asiatica]|uniref:hypothetical protein n=1 Tax=Nocardia asiatica TaxID=209252 RepID=UPI003EE0D48B